MKRFLLLSFFVLFSSAINAAEGWRLNIDPVEVGALVGKFGAAGLEKKNEEHARALLVALAALRFYQTIKNNGNYDIGSMFIENAIVIFGRDLFLPKKQRPFSQEEEEQEKKTNWSLFWKLFKADLFGTFLGYFCQMKK